MSGEREFATEFGGRLLAIEAVLYRLLVQMPDGRAFLDEVEITLDKAHADHLENIQPEHRGVFLDIMKAASSAVGKMHDQLKD